jgi:hypothetical protein
MDWVLSMEREIANKNEAKSGAVFRQSKRSRNIAVLAAVLGFSGLFYLITIVRMF